MERATSFVHQGILEKTLREIFVGQKFLTNVRKGAHVTNPGSGYFLEIDIWLPDYSLCFEFQDVYHYATTWDSQFPLAYIEHKDYAKREIVRNRLETLILVPCWWDGTRESLMSSIQFHRPDVLPFIEYNNIISLNPPPDFFEFDKIPNVGELMLASFPTVPLTDLFNTSWWLGEKYDGIRCCWNSERKKLYSRKAMVLVLPNKMHASITTKNFLDTELWFGRGTFTQSQKISNPFGEAALIEWFWMRMIAFDRPPASSSLPSSLSSSVPPKGKEFEKRYASLVNDCSLALHAFLVIASRWLCTSKAMLTAAAKTIIKDGGEGVIIRSIRSLYIHGRSEHLIKFKADRGDQEALVMEVKPKNTFVMQLPDGTVFELSNPALPEDVKPKKGDIVTFTYSNFSRTSVPVQPKIFRIRKDVTWKEIVQTFAKDAAQAKILNGQGARGIGHSAPMPIGHWTSQKNKNMRILLETFAKKSGFDFLVASNWYTCKRENFAKMKGSRSALRHFGGSFIKMLMSLFPEIGLEESKFDFLPQNYWKDAKNRRRFFERVAKRQNFDALKAKNWYKADFIELRKQKGAHTVLGYYGNSIINALMHLFPEINLVVEDFYDRPKGYWANDQNHKKFLIDLAASRGFDPLVPINWYRLRQGEVKEFKSGSSFLSYYQRSYVRAVMHHFPNIGLQRHEFIHTQKNFWGNNRRVFFEKFAKARGFSPTDPNAWYFVKPQDIFQERGARTVVAHIPKQDPVLAIMDAFPDIGLVREKFISGTHWLFANNRKRFFEDFAKEHMFEPHISTNWDKITKQQLLAHKKGAKDVLLYYGMNHLKAIRELFP